ncbi:MAG: glycosyltransferase family 2 protein [Bacteroidota bacterium]
MGKLSAVIITFNEEKNIRRCIESLKNVADEIVVIDSFSQDQTVAISKELGAKVIQHPFEGHIQQKNYALTQASYDHILSLDADEALTEELTQSIQAIKADFSYSAYTFNRKTNFCGKWIRYCGWYPDKKLRIWDRTLGKWGGTNPHDKVVMDPNTSRSHLSGDLLHYSFYTIRQHIQQINLFTDISAQAAYEKGKRSNLGKIFFKPLFKFFQSYFLKLGILDGYYGLVICVNSAHAKFLKYTKLYELQKQGEKT